MEVSSQQNSSFKKLKINPHEASIRAPIKNLPFEDRGCKYGLDDRSSDLCAQWAAVDANRKSAEYGAISAILSLLGFCAVAVTIYQSKISTQRQLRAYIKLDVPWAPAPETLRNGQFRISVENYGQTPALNTTFRTCVFMAEIPLPREFSPTSWNNAGSGTVVHPRHNSDFGAPVSLSENEAKLAANPEANLQLYVMAEVAYEDVFGSKHIERICNRLSMQPDGNRIEPARFGNLST